VPTKGQQRSAAGKVIRGQESQTYWSVHLVVAVVVVVVLILINIYAVDHRRKLTLIWLVSFLSFWKHLSGRYYVPGADAVYRDNQDATDAFADPTLLENLHVNHVSSECWNLLSLGSF